MLTLKDLTKPQLSEVLDERDIEKNEQKLYIIMDELFFQDNREEVPIYRVTVCRERLPTEEEGSREIKGVIIDLYFNSEDKARKFIAAISEYEHFVA